LYFDRRYQVTYITDYPRNYIVGMRPGFFGADALKIFGNEKTKSLVAHHSRDICHHNV